MANCTRTPNGFGQAWLLSEHKEQLGRKYVDSVVVFQYAKSGYWNLIFEIKDVPESEEDDKKCRGCCCDDQ